MVRPEISTVKRSSPTTPYMAAWVRIVSKIRGIFEAIIPRGLWLGSGFVGSLQGIIEERRRETLKNSIVIEHKVTFGVQLKFEPEDLGRHCYYIADHTRGGVYGESTYLGCACSNEQ